MNGGHFPHISPETSARLDQAGDIFMRLGGVDTNGLEHWPTILKRLREAQTPGLSQDQHNPTPPVGTAPDPRLWLDPRRPNPFRSREVA